MITVDDFTRLTGTWPEWLRNAYHIAQARWDAGELGCTAVYKKGKWGRHDLAGTKCRSKPGKGTTHEGWGHCVAHRGAWKVERAIGSWLMAHQFAQEYDLSPWESLLYVIRVTAGRVRYCEQVLAAARRDEELEGRGVGDPLGVEVGGALDGQVIESRDLRWWVETSERERILLAKVSKAAIDAGVAQLLVERELAAGNQIADHMLGVWEDLREAGMPQPVLDTVLEAMKRRLVSLDAVARELPSGSSSDASKPTG